MSSLIGSQASDDKGGLKVESSVRFTLPLWTQRPRKPGADNDKAKIIFKKTISSPDIWTADFAEVQREDGLQIHPSAAEKVCLNFQEGMTVYFMLHIHLAKKDSLDQIIIIIIRRSKTTTKQQQ